jgi:hypothetical protein
MSKATISAVRQGTNGYTLNSRFIHLLATVAAIIMTALSVPLPARAFQNFHDQAGRKGCASIITVKGQEDCEKIYAEQTKMCGVSLDCDVKKHEATIKEYTEAKAKLASGKYNAAEKEVLEKSIANLKQELDANKEAARKGAQLAQQCLTARQNVQTWFKEEGAKITVEVRDRALAERRQLLEKLADAQKRQTAAKAAREAKPDDSSARSEYERTTGDMRNAENALAEFNRKYGTDIEESAQKLLNHYEAQAQSHETALKETGTAVENCKRIDNSSY